MKGKIIMNTFIIIGTVELIITTIVFRVFKNFDIFDGLFNDNVKFVCSFLSKPNKKRWMIAILFSSIRIACCIPLMVRLKRTSIIERFCPFPCAS